MKILVCGDRHYSRASFIRARLNRIPRLAVIIHGGAKGADTLAGEIAKELGFTVVPIYAEWDKYGRIAGPIRNRKMLDLKPELVIAFHDDIENSKGTKDCVQEAKRRGISVEVIDGKNVLP